MLSLPDTYAVQANAAADKVALARTPARFAASAMLAGAYVGVAVVLMLSAAGPLRAVANPSEKLVSGLVFGVALTLVVYAGAELSTSTMMTLPQGAIAGSITPAAASWTLAFSFLGNLIGALGFAGLVSASGVLTSNAAAGEMLAGMLDAKAHESIGQLFFRGILCNILVCVAIWSCARLTSEVAKAIVIFWSLLAFITSGFEHVVANMTTFGLGLFAPEPLTTVGEFGRNLLWVGLGNLVGGAVVVGLGYAVAAGAFATRRARGAALTDSTAVVPSLSPDVGPLAPSGVLSSTDVAHNGSRSSSPTHSEEPSRA